VGTELLSLSIPVSLSCDVPPSPRITKVEYDAAVEQLEKERKEASTRAKKLQQKLKEMQKERDSTRSKLSGYKQRLAELKESSSREIAELQGKVLTVSLNVESVCGCTIRKVWFQRLHDLV